MFENPPNSTKQTFISRMPEHWEKNVLSVSHAARGESNRAVINFLNVQLRSAGSFSVYNEYPSLFGEFPGGESIVVKLNGHVASHVGLIVREFQHTNFRIKIGMIGCVATATEFRNRGFATELVKQACLQLRRRGCSIALLWSDQIDFYSPLGFQRMGRELDLRFSSKSVPEFSDLKPIPFEFRKHAHLLWRLYQKHDVKLDRSLEEQKRLCEVPKMRLFVTERAGALTSYVAIGKGADFNGYIHEWGGDTDDVLKNVCGVQKLFYPEQDLTFISPEHYELNALRRIAISETHGVLGLMKVIDRQSLMNAFCHYLKSSSIEQSWDRERATFKLETQHYKLDSDLDYLRLIFGDSTASDHPTVPFFLWGLDSI